MQLEDSLQSIVEQRPPPRHVSKNAAEHPHQPSPEYDVFISWVNNNPHISWQANTCMLSKTHPDYDHKLCQSKENELILIDDTSNTNDGEVKTGDLASPPLKQELAGVGKKQFGKDKDFGKVYDKIEALRKKYKTADEIPDKEVPQDYDLSNIEGFDFTGKVRDQGSCGSCYTVSFVQAVESRLKYNTGKDSGPLSAQHIL